MRHLLATLALLLLVTGCGSDSAGAGASSGDQDPRDDPSVEASTVTLVSATAGGGEPATQATPLADDAALASYVQQFERSFGATVAQAADRVSVDDGEVLLAQVVSIGCDKPLGATLRQGADGLAMVPTPVESPRRECFAAVTTVGLAAVPVSLAGAGS